MTTERITLDRVREVAGRIAAESPDHVHARACYLDNAGNSVCINARVFLDLGLPKRVLVNEAFADAVVREWDGVAVEPTAVVFLENLQAIADHKVPWGKAFEIASSLKAGQRFTDLESLDRYRLVPA